MATEAREVSVELLRTLTPLEGMKRENLHALAKKVTVKQMPAGRVLFKEGDTDKRTVWIVSGTVELREDDRIIGAVTGGTLEARNAVAPKLPREFSVRAMDHVEYLSIDSELLDVMITWDQTGT